NDFYNQPKKVRQPLENNSWQIKGLRPGIFCSCFLEKVRTRIDNQTFKRLSKIWRKNYNYCRAEFCFIRAKSTSRFAKYFQILSCFKTLSCKGEVLGLRISPKIVFI